MIRSRAAAGTDAIAATISTRPVPASAIHARKRILVTFSSIPGGGTIFGRYFERPGGISVRPLATPLGAGLDFGPLVEDFPRADPPPLPPPPPPAWRTRGRPSQGTSSARSPKFPAP